MSCAGTTFISCIAGGFYTDGSQHQHAITMDGSMEPTGVGASWGAAGEVPGITDLPGYNAASPFATVSAVSCLATTDCSASGFYTDIHGATQVFTGGENNATRWSTQVIPGAAELNAGGRAFVNGMSCGAPGECAIVGNFKDSSSQSQAFADAQSDGLFRNAQQILGVNDNPFAGATNGVVWPQAHASLCCKREGVAAATILSPMRRPLEPFSSISSRHSVSPASRCARQALTNCPNKDASPLNGVKDLFRCCCKSIPRMAPAAGLMVLSIKSASTEITPEDNSVKTSLR